MSKCDKCGNKVVDTGFNDEAVFWCDEIGIDATQDNIDDICVAMDDAGREKAEAIKSGEE